MTTAATITCRFCGVETPAQRPTKRFCSVKCATQTDNNRQTCSSECSAHRAARARRSYQKSLPRETIRQWERRYQLRKKFGIQLEEYEALLARQTGKCAICRRPPDEVRAGKSLAVDHDHESGKIRGLLCDPCNLALGCFQDNLDLFRSAIDLTEA